MTRSGRPRKKSRTKPPPPDRLEPTAELIDHRAVNLARVIGLYPQPIAATLARDPDAAWYIGRLYLAKVITMAERDAAEAWKRTADDYGRLLMLPKRPGAVDMSRREPAPPTNFENDKDVERFRRLKHKYERYWDAVAIHGVVVLRATTGALVDFETPMLHLQPGLRALVRA